jgi:hypothetical protein
MMILVIVVGLELTNLIESLADFNFMTDEVCFIFYLESSKSLDLLKSCLPKGRSTFNEANTADDLHCKSKNLSICGVYSERSSRPTVCFV